MDQILKALPVIGGIIAVILIICIGYVKAPPDTAYIISGFRKPRILIGKAGMGIDLKSLIAGALGGKLATADPAPQVVVAPQPAPQPAPAAPPQPEAPVPTEE